MSGSPVFTESLIEALRSNPQDFRISRRVPVTKDNVAWPFQLCTAKQTVPVILVAGRQTGYGASHPLFELSVVRCRYCLDSEALCSIDGFYHGLSDAGDLADAPPPMQEHAKAAAGCSFDLQKLTELFRDDPVVLALHDAECLCPAVTRLDGRFEALRWACLEHDVNWFEFGNHAETEKHLTELGWFYEDDVYLPIVADTLAMAWRLHLVPDALRKAVRLAMQPTKMIKVYGSVDLLGLGYRRCISDSRGCYLDESECHFAREVFESTVADEIEKIRRLDIDKFEVETVSERARYKAHNGRDESGRKS